MPEEPFDESFGDRWPVKALRILERVATAANRASMAVACIFLCVLTGLVAVAVICRYVFNAPVSFAEEISQYMMVGIVFLGLGYVMQKDRHIRVELIYDLVPAGIKTALAVIIEVATLVYAVLMTGASVSLFWCYLERGSRAFTILETPLMYPALLLVVGSGLLTLQIVSQVLRRCLSGGITVDHGSATGELSTVVTPAAKRKEL